MASQNTGPRLPDRPLTPQMPDTVIVGIDPSLHEAEVEREEQKTLAPEMQERGSLLELTAQSRENQQKQGIDYMDISRLEDGGLQE